MPGNIAWAMLALMLAAPAAPAAEEAWPGNSASDLSIFVTMLRYRIHADLCSARLPELKPRFDSLIDGLDARVQVLSRQLLATDEYKAMKGKPVPAVLVDALKDSFHDTEHNVARLDASTTCPKALKEFDGVDDRALKSGLEDSLTAIRNMMRRLEEQRADRR